MIVLSEKKQKAITAYIFEVDEITEDIINYIYQSKTNELAENITSILLTADRADLQNTFRRLSNDVQMELANILCVHTFHRHKRFVTRSLNGYGTGLFRNGKEVIRLRNEGGYIFYGSNMDL